MGHTEHAPRVRVMSSSRQHRAAVLTLVLASVLSACGSTVQVGGTRTTGDALGGVSTPSGELGAVAAPGESAVTPQATGGNAPQVSTGRAGGTGSSTGSPRQLPSPGATRPPLLVPGVTSTTIKFGAAYSTDTGEANAALGANLDQGDARQYYNALVKQVNAAGGIAGRKLVPSYFEVKSTSTASADSVDQAACEKWTRDDPVFAVFGGTSELFRSCAERAGVVNLYSGASNSLARTFRRYLHYVEVSSLALDRAERATAEGLARTDYFGTKPTIGVVAWDDPNYRSAVESSLVPTLRGLGYAVKARAYVKVAQDNSQVGDSSAAASNAVLTFRNSGVDHVLIVDGPAGVFGGTGLTLLFVKAAGAQLYHPRYGLNDSNSPESGRQAGLWSADDMRGARVVSWDDVLDESDKGAAPNVRRKACLGLMAHEGISTTDLNARGAALRACDYVWFLRDTLGVAPAAISRDVFIGAVNRLGSSYRSPMLYGTSFAAGQHDGVGKLRLMKLDDTCGCFVYASAPYPAPPH